MPDERVHVTDEQGAPIQAYLERIPLREHLAALREAAKELQEERDRRYREVGAEREKALKIKEQADRDALELARQIQTYKDQQHNGLLDQLKDERSTYATKVDLDAAIARIEAITAPIVTYVASQQGQSKGLNAGWVILLGVVSLIGGLLLIGSIIVGIAYAIRGAG